jgi:hypothetical protein
MASFAIECPTMSKKYDSFLSICCEQKRWRASADIVCKTRLCLEINRAKIIADLNKTGESG